MKSSYIRGFFTIFVLIFVFTTCYKSNAQSNTTRSEAIQYTDERNFRVRPVTGSTAIEIIGYTGQDWQVNIPLRINNLPVISIGDNAFKRNDIIMGVTIPTSVTSIGNEAFSGCTSLITVTIPTGVTSIGNSAFYDCTSLTSVTIPTSITSIGDSVFCNCTSLASVSIPTSVTSIEVAAFASCENLVNITIPASVISIGQYSFADCSSLTSVTIPANITNIGIEAFSGCANLIAINVVPNNTAFSSVDGILYNKDQTALIMYPAGKIGNFTIPTSVTSIEDAAFMDCSSLTTISIPNHITSIGRNSFANTGLTNIVIPPSVTDIGNCAFSWCSNLTKVTIPSSIVYTEGDVFSQCPRISSVTFTGNNELREIVIHGLFPSDSFNERGNYFLQNLHWRYENGGQGTYIRADGSSDWTKQ